MSAGIFRILKKCCTTTVNYLFLYADGWQLSKNPAEKAIYAQITEETISWLQREMLSPKGAIYSSLDADSLDAHE